MHSSAMDAKTFLQLVLDHRGTNPNQLREKTKNSAIQSSASRILTGVTKNPRRDTVTPLARELGVNVEAFLSSVVAIEELKRLGISHSNDSRDVLATSTASNIEPGPDAHGSYPLISEVQAGNWTELQDNFAPGDAEEWLPSTKNLGPHGYMLRVKGDSMTNPGSRLSFPDGTILHVKPGCMPTPGQFVIVRREHTQEATFKRYVLIDSEPYLEAINPDWPKEKKYLPLRPGDEWCGVVVDASLGGLP